MIFTKLYICLLVCVWATSQSVSSLNSTKGTEINGQTLLNFGRKYNKTLLSVIGMALINLHPCGEWTQWSNCESKKIGYYNVRKRSRSCGRIEETSQKLMPTVEDDYSFCEGGQCPEHYNMTSEGYCLKLYLETKNNTDAEAQCGSDGGYLVNIDSDKKYTAVKGVLTGFRKNINIGGRRKDSSSPWEYKYGSQKGFFSWYSGYPLKNLCLALSNPRLFYDHKCNVAYPFICEIPQL